MANAKNIAKERSSEYATREQFCKIFDEDMNNLYLLSFLLAADHKQAEQCFVFGLEDSVEGSPVFKDWARSWARLMIIQNAQRVIKPQPSDESDLANSTPTAIGDKSIPLAQPEIASVLELRSFERFVFVMSVLERYSDQDCSILLGCTRRDVIAGRTRALQQVGSRMKLYREEHVGTSDASLRCTKNRSSVSEPETTPPLPTWA